MGRPPHRLLGTGWLLDKTLQCSDRYPYHRRVAWLAHNGAETLKGPPRTGPCCSHPWPAGPAPRGTRSWKVLAAGREARGPVSTCRPAPHLPGPATAWNGFGPLVPGLQPWSAGTGGGGAGQATAFYGDPRQRARPWRCPWKSETGATWRAVLPPPSTALLQARPNGRRHDHDGARRRPWHRRTQRATRVPTWPRGQPPGCPARRAGTCRHRRRAPPPGLLDATGRPPPPARASGRTPPPEGGHQPSSVTRARIGGRVSAPNSQPATAPPAQRLTPAGDPAPVIGVLWGGPPPLAGHHRASAMPPP